MILLRAGDPKRGGEEKLAGRRGSFRKTEAECAARTKIAWDSRCFMGRRNARFALFVRIIIYVPGCLQDDCRREGWLAGWLAGWRHE